ncbi:MAG: Cna B-type domain-containing protein, partial [Anaerolineaceae bacterium]|nr:Cna B-type domain-containing protein [Anaerolineaceae bacterium]
MSSNKPNTFRKTALQTEKLAIQLILLASMLLSAVFPAAAELQRPAGTAVTNPYNYVSSGAISNPSGSATTVSAAQLKENSYTTNTGMCGQDVNNGTFTLSYTPTLTDDLYTYQLTKKTTNLKTNATSTEQVFLGNCSTQIYKLLNVYPTDEGNIGYRIMNETRPDGGRYYNDPYTGCQILTFDSVYWDTFMANPTAYMKNADGTWKYDGIYFGAADNNGGKDFSDAASTPVTQYIQAGYGVVVGHDVDIHQSILNSYFGYGGGNMAHRGSTVYVSDNSGRGTAGSSSEGNKLTTYPYKFSIGSALSINESHIQRHVSAAYTDVWLTYTNDSHLTDGYYTDAYLFTSKAYPNVATSQAGHTTPSSVDLMLIINMLTYILPKRNTPNTTSMSVRDIAAPARPTVSAAKRTGKTNLTFNVSAADYASKFDFTLQASGVYNSTTKSAITMNNAAIKSGTAWYLYSADNNQSGTISYTTNCLGLPVASSGTTMIQGGETVNNVAITIPADARWLHIAAVDRAGNVSEVATVEIPRTENLTITKSFSDQNNRFSTRPSSVVFDAFPGNSTTSSGSCTASSSNNWKCVIEDLLAYDTSGNTISYTVKERNTPKAYTSNMPTVVIANVKTAAVTNTLVTKSITVNKQFLDRENTFGTRPGSLIFDA